MSNQELDLNQQPQPGAIAASELAISEPCEIISPGSPISEIFPNAYAKSLSDDDLLAKVKSAFHNWRDNVPYIREARDRFAKPGRRFPVLGELTWSEWVEQNLGVGIRRVQQLLAESEEGSGKGNGTGTSTKPKVKPFALPGLTEVQIAKVVEKAAVIGPEVASRLVYDAVVQPDFKAGDMEPERALEPVRTTVKRCLDGRGKPEQLVVLQALQEWVNGSVDELKEELNPTKKRMTFIEDEPNVVPPDPATFLEKPEQGAAACA